MMRLDNGLYQRQAQTRTGPLEVSLAGTVMPGIVNPEKFIKDSLVMLWIDANTRIFNRNFDTGFVV